MLSVNDLSFSYRSREVLKDVSFTVKSGELVSVLGPNGVGKSTLFRCILQLLTDYTGTVSVNGADARTLSQRELASHIAYIPQIHRPAFGFTVLDTVLMGVTGRHGPLVKPTKAHTETAMETLERLSIAELAYRNYSQLSGGEQQLVLIARAMSQKADILIMDEPTSALDYGNQMRVLAQVRRLADEGYSVLLSTHNPQHALTFSDAIIALADRHIAACGAPEKVLTAELLEKLYGIRVSIEDTPYGRVIVAIP